MADGSVTVTYASSEDCETFMCAYLASSWRLEFKSIMHDASGLHTNRPLKHVNITEWSLTSALTVLIWMNIAEMEPQFWKFQ